MRRAIRNFFKDPEPVSDFSEVENGLNYLDGIARIEEPLRSPLRGANCVGFYYQSFAVTRGGRAVAQHKLKQVEVYTSFELLMDGGTVKVVPAKPGDFSVEDHRALAEQYGKAYHATEEVILPGARLRIKGKVKEEDGCKVLRMKTLIVLETQAVAAGVVGDRKERKAKAKRKRKKGA